MAQTPATARDKQVKAELVEYLRKVPFERAVEQERFRELMEEDAESDHPLYPPDARRAFDEARAVRAARRAGPGAFFSNKSVVLVPGFMGSQLRDDGANGLIWIDPTLYVRPAQLSALKLAPYAGLPERDATGVAVREDGAVPVLYAGLKYYLESGRCEVRTAGFDWRVDIDQTAGRLADTLRGYAAEHPGRPLFVVAHSQGSLVARRALQLLGKEAARRTVNRLVLLGPASYGTFSAAFALAGNHSMIQTLAHYGLRWPADTPDVLRSMTGLYQLLPWKPGTVGMDPQAMKAAAFWGPDGCDPARLDKFFRWGESVDTAFFNDRTTIILGDAPNTPAAVGFNAAGVLEATAFAHGDGTVTDACAVLEGVGDVGRAEGADHMTLPLSRTVMQTVWRVITANLNVQGLRASRPARGAVVRVAERARPGAATAGVRRVPVTALPEPTDLRVLAGVAPPAGRVGPVGPDVPPPPAPALNDPPPAPPCRRLRVFSFDPLQAADPAGMGTATLTLELPWDEESADAAKLQPGPVGEYLEVVDYDPASRCFYPPVDLNHPNLLAQDGLPPSEGDPRFHQQMVYAVGMATIAVFERALGRTVQWSPYLPRDDRGRVRRDFNGRPDREYVRRLRIYPHALRDANAYYDPTRKALLFGYFPARAKPGGRVLPAGTVFTCLSYDVIAHEMTHALLDGVNRHLLDPSNPDVLAFHEAFADVVALFQHFSHPGVLRGEVARVAGQLGQEGMLGRLAQQFGEAMGLHGSLRSYLGRENPDTGQWEPIRPDPTRYESDLQPHDRGSLLVAALFAAFQTIYTARTRDLRRIASGGTGLVPAGDLHPDLVDRLADEAAKAARHLLLMAVRALDYLPPVDLTFGDYLRALVTADADLHPADARFYRVAVVDAFRRWGIYPRDVRTLSADGLVWNPPDTHTLALDMDLFRDILALGNGTLRLDRAEMYRLQRRVQKELHAWLRGEFARDPELAREWGLAADPTAPPTIRRDRHAGGDPLPRFDVTSVRRCRRDGPDGQDRVDVLVTVVQKRAGYFDPDAQEKADSGKRVGPPDFDFRGGVTLVIDPRAGRVRYAVHKDILSARRLAEVRAFAGGGGGALGLRGNYFGRDRASPLAHLHAGED